MDTVIKFSESFINHTQNNNIVATAKHFGVMDMFVEISQRTYFY